MEDKLSLKEASGIQIELRSIQTVQLAPGQAHTFFAKEGRKYRVVATNIDDSYEAYTTIYDGDWGHLAGKLNLAPFESGSVGVDMAKQNGVRVYNQSNEQSPGRPRISYTLYNV